MNIFQFELGDLKKIPLKKGYPENNVFYTGTHDNQTIMSFYNELSDEARRVVDKLCDIKFTDKPNLKIIEFAMKQNSKYVIKHKSTKSIYNFIDIQRFSSKIGAKKVRKKATPQGRSFYTIHCTPYTDQLCCSSYSSPQTFLAG